MPLMRMRDITPGDLICTRRDDGTVSRVPVRRWTFVHDDKTENVISLDLGDGVTFYAPSGYVVDVQLHGAFSR